MIKAQRWTNLLRYYWDVTLLLLYKLVITLHVSPSVVHSDTKKLAPEVFSEYHYNEYFTEPLNDNKDRDF